MDSYRSKRTFLPPSPLSVVDTPVCVVGRRNPFSDHRVRDTASNVAWCLYWRSICRWSSMLTPEIFFYWSPITGPDLDFLNPTLSNYLRHTTALPFFSPTTRQDYLLVPSSINGYSEPNIYA